MTDEAGPVRAQRRRNIGTGAGILLVAAIVVAAMVTAGHTGPSNPTPVSTQAAVAAPPTSAAPTSAAADSPPSSAGTSAASATAGHTTAPGAGTGPVLDVDGDGRADTASTQFTDGRTAKVVVHLATGKTLTSKAFPLYRQGGAGKVFGADVNGDHRSELLVSDPGADGTGYHLFSYVRSALVAVSVPRGNGLYVGGGMYYDSTFGCAGGRLLQVTEAPEVKNRSNLPADPPFLVTTTTYALTAGVLKATDTTTIGVANRAAAAARLAATGNGCGTRP